MPAPRRVKVTVKGRKATYPVVGTDSPVQAIVTLGDSSALFNAMKPAHPELEYLRSPNGTLTAIVLPPTGSAAPP